MIEMKVLLKEYGKRLFKKKLFLIILSLNISATEPLKTNFEKILARYTDINYHELLNVDIKDIEVYTASNDYSYTVDFPVECFKKLIRNNIGYRKLTIDDCDSCTDLSGLKHNSIFIVNKKYRIIAQYPFNQNSLTSNVITFEIVKVPFVEYFRLGFNQNVNCLTNSTINNELNFEGHIDYNILNDSTSSLNPLLQSMMVYPNDTLKQPFCILRKVLQFKYKEFLKSNKNIEGYIDLTVNPNNVDEITIVDDKLNDGLFYNAITKALFDLTGKYKIFGTFYDEFSSNIFTMRITFCPGYYFEGRCYVNE